eukprot:TRINITY_DN1254_c0_g2_i1.p2 TRINITY_DN1254_c0_g2~~TRINITY_DN1254_c0_g2_i1.p2  ORF type:complete len:102 (-),score=24.47 TRINITY_DN1254_c0_g2_i1:68-373(-)
MLPLEQEQEQKQELNCLEPHVIPNCSVPRAFGSFAAGDGVARTQQYMFGGLEGFNCSPNMTGAAPTSLRAKRSYDAITPRFAVGLYEEAAAAGPLVGWDSF